MTRVLTRRGLLGAVAVAGPAAAALAAVRDADRAGPPPSLTKHGLVATETGRWAVPEANQAAAVDAAHFYGIGNHALVKHRKDSGERVAQWSGPRGGAIVHFNSGYVDGDRLVLAHSNFPQLPMASSIETHDARTLLPRATHSLGIRLGSLTWAVRHQGSWWACFANYNDSGTTPGFDQRGNSSCSGGGWGDDGLLYVTGHDAPELYVLRLPRQGVTLEYVTTIDVPFEGQGWAWDRSARGQRVIYGISRARQEVVAARIPPVRAAVAA
jgi:hypothetical protein